jgi:hypothetical protein
MWSVTALNIYTIGRHGRLLHWYVISELKVYLLAINFSVVKRHMVAVSKLINAAYAVLMNFGHMISTGYYWELNWNGSSSNSGGVVKYCSAS